ncbi:MAG: RagB/SusD family nutrient uptake outer membrane protein [Thalassobius sp.]|nr:RagB/SusD family nutrient uptake outer membrane protein [Thalassovita sp.]
MKKIIFPIITLLISMAACTDLEIEPKSSATSAVVFNDESSYTAFIAKVYAGLAVTGQLGPAGDADIKGIDEGFSNYLRQYWQIQELTTEEAVITWGDEGLDDLNAHTWTSANQFITATYYRIFFQVSMANEFLRETTDGKLDERGVSDETRALIQEYRAEARFLRALSYWHGIDLFGSIPFYTEETEIGSSAPEQVDRTTVFNFLDEELQAIEEDMVAAGQNEYGRADRGALWMLQAKLYLNAEVYTGQQKYTEAITAVNKIISSGAYGLEENYGSNFLADNHNSGEIIFSIPFDGERTITWGGMTYLVHAPVGGGMDPATYGIDGGWAGLRTTKTFVNLFPDVTGSLDTRAMFYTEGQSLEINDQFSFTDGYAIPKFKNVDAEGLVGSDLTHPDTDYPMFRLADAYLMYAEAVLRGGAGGDQSQALSYINELRARSYTSTAAGTVSADNFTLDFILDERARELFWEGHRRTDLIRFGEYTSMVWPWKKETKDGQASEEFRELLPIPSSELLANPNLEQNEGY